MYHTTLEYSWQLPEEGTDSSNVYKCPEASPAGNWVVVLQDTLGFSHLPGEEGLEVDWINQTSTEHL